MRRRERLILTAILFLGAALRMWGLSFGLPHPDTRPDETIIVVTAAGLLYQGLNPHFFSWPSLEFYVVSAIYRIGWEIGHRRGVFDLKFDMYKDAAVHAGPFLIVPRVLAVIAGVATIWLTYKLMDRLVDRLTALTAAFFVAIAFLLVRDSHFGVTDVPMTALVIATLVAVVAAIEKPDRARRWALAGSLGGLAAATKYSGGLVVIAALAALALVRREGATPRDIGRGAVALVVAAIAGFLCGTPYAVLDAPHFLEGVRFDVSHLMEGHGIVLGRGWIYHLTFSLWYGLGGPLFIAGLGGLILLAATSRRNAVLIGTFPLLYYAAVGPGNTVFVRYMTPVAPFLCMAAAVGIVWVVRKFAKTTVVAGTVALIAAAVAIPSLVRSVAFDVLLRRTDSRVIAQQWLAAHVPAPETIGQIPPVLIYPDFGIAKPAMVATFDVDRQAFVSQNGTSISPDWIVVAVSALTLYTVQPEQLDSIANRGYVRETTIPATHGPEMSRWFDQQDLFFMPFTTFTMRDRPGPEIQIFRRRG